MPSTEPGDLRRATKRGNGKGLGLLPEIKRALGCVTVDTWGQAEVALLPNAPGRCAETPCRGAGAEAGCTGCRSQATLGKFLRRWLQDSVKPTNRPSTYETYSAEARLHIVPDLGNVLAPLHLQQLYAKKLEAGRAPATVNLIHVVLRRSLKQAKRWGVAGRNVAAEHVDPPARTRLDGTDRALTAPQIGSLVIAMRGHRYERLWRILLATGLRFGEAAALRWEEVVLDGRTVAVRRSLTRIPGGYAFNQPKTTSGRRIIPRLGCAAEKLRTHQEHQKLEQRAGIELGAARPGWPASLFDAQMMRA
jgi:integrase